MTVHIGTAPDSWGVWFAEHELQPPWRQFLDEAAEAGYTAIELGPFGYLPTDIGTLRGELHARGLTLASAFIYGDMATPGAWPALKDEAARLCNILAAFEARHLVLIPRLYSDLLTGQLVASETLDGAGWRALADTCNKIGAFSASLGIRSVFHPHAGAPIEYESQIERLLELTDPDVHGLCLDVGHHAYCGGDPVAFALKHRDRLQHMHLKNVDAGLAERVRRDGTSFAQAVRQGIFTELDQGVVDFEALRDTLKAIGYDGWGIVEQDMFPTPFDRPLPVARRNREYLHSIAMGD